MYHKKKLAPDDINNLRVNLSARVLKFSTEPVCDFCAGPKPVWLYAARRMSTGDPVVNWRWLACDICSNLVDSEDWGALETRISDVLKRLVAVEEVNAVVLSIIQLQLDEFKQYAIRVVKKPS